MIRRSSRIVLEVLAALVAGLVLLVGLGAWRLSRDEPIRLGFLTTYLEQALTAPGGDFTVRIEDTVLTWAGWERTFDLRASNVRALGPDGRVIAAVPEVAVTLSVRALLRGMVAPTAIDIFRPRVFLIRERDGRFRVGRGGAAEAPELAGEEESPILPALLGELQRVPDHSRQMGYLENANMIDARLVLLDRRTGITWRASDADILLRRVPRGVAGALSVAVDQLGRPARLQVDALYDRAQQSVELSAGFADVSLARLAELDKDLAALAGAALTAQGRIATTIDLDGSIGDSRFTVATGSGSLLLPGAQDEPLPIEGLRLAGRLEAGGDRLTLEEAGLWLDGAQLTGSATVSGLVWHALPKHGAVRVSGQLTAADLPVETLKRYWPAGAAKGARKWVLRNLGDGLVEHVELDMGLRFPGGRPDAAVIETLNGAFSAVGLTVHYLQPMPPLRDVAGIASFTDHEFVVDLNGGVAEGVRVEGGRLRIADFYDRDQIIEIDGRLRAALPDALRLLDHPRLGLTRKVGIDPAETAGETATRLRLRFPAIDELELEDLGLQVTAEIAGAELRGMAFGRDVTQGDFAVEVDSQSMVIAGDAEIAGTPARIRWEESFADSAAVRSRIALSGRPDAAQRAALGLDFLPYLDGPVPTDLLLTRYPGGRSEVEARFDLTPATLDLSFIDWSKPAGEPGEGELTLVLEGDRATEISALRVAAGDLAARGRGRFAEDGGELRTVALDSAAFGGSDLRDVAVTFGVDGRIDVVIGGGRFDAEPWLAADDREDETDEEDEEKAPFTLRADRLEEIRLGPDRALHDAAVSLRHDGAFWDEILLDAALPGARALSFRYAPAPEGGKHRLAVAADDAGAALRAFDVIGNVEGGRLTIAGEADHADPVRALRGAAEISEFRLVNAPFLARLLTVATLTGLVDVLSGEGFLFTRFKGDFTKREGQLEVPLARAYGPSIGLTAKGVLDFDADQVDVAGTIVPAYAINAFLANIPVVGDILGGGKGEGMFAATYQAKGALSEPEITVNPLAALAPGFLRGLFDMLGEGGEGVEPTALPAPGTNK